MRTLLRISPLLLLPLIPACGGSDGDSGGDNADAGADACMPEETRECTCRDDSASGISMGTQTCGDDGAFGVCSCSQDGPEECNAGDRQLCACRDAEGAIPRLTTPGFRTCLPGNTYTPCECLSVVSESELRQFYPIDAPSADGVHPFPCSKDSTGESAETVNYEFDENGRLTSRRAVDGQGELRINSDYRYNDFGNITRMTVTQRIAGTEVESLHLASYMENNTVMRVESRLVDNDFAYEQFTYTLEGPQRLVAEGSSQNLPERSVYEFDSSGRMIRRETDRDGEVTITTFNYNPRNQLIEMNVDVQAELRDDEIWQFTYDNTGRRTRTDRFLDRDIAGQGMVMRFLDSYWTLEYDGNELKELNQFLFDVSTGMEMQIRSVRYVYDPAGNVIQEIERPAPGAGVSRETEYDYSCWE